RAPAADPPPPSLPPLGPSRTASAATTAPAWGRRRPGPGRLLLGRPDDQALETLAPTPLEDRAARLGGVALAESVRHVPFHLGRLVGRLPLGHDAFSPSRSMKEGACNARCRSSQRTPSASENRAHASLGCGRACEEPW